MVKINVYKPIFPALGGLNTAVDPAIIGDSQLTKADNIVLVTNGARATRFGQSRLNTTALNASAKILHIVDFFLSNGTQKTVVKAGSKYYADTNADGVFADITGGASISATSIVTTSIINNKLIICSNVEAPYVYTQTGNIALLGGSPPNGRFCRVHLGRLWISGVSGNEHRIYYSQAYDPTQWTTGAGYLDIDPDDGSKDGITAIFPSFQGDLVVAKVDKLYKISGFTPSTFKIVPITMNVGCVSHNSIAAVQNDIIFASERGITSLQTAQNVKGDVQSTFLSAAIHNLFQTINKSRFQHIQGVFVPQLNSYLFACAIRNTTDNNRVFGFNILINEWFEWTGYLSNSMAMIRDTSDNLRLANGDNVGFVNKYNEEVETTPYSDFGTTAIAYKIRTGVIYVDKQPHQHWDFKGLFITAKVNVDATITVAWKIDNLAERSTTVSLDITGSVLGTMKLNTDTLGGTSTLIPYYVPLDGMGHGIQLTISLSSQLSRLEIYGYELEVRGSSDSYEVRT